MNDAELKAWMLQELSGHADIVLSEDQEEAMRAFLQFLRSGEDRSTYLLTGSAGTGKTFLIGLFTRILTRSGYKVILLAPTGRAAKVITRRTKRLAYTIHHHIYSPQDDGMGGVRFATKENKEKGRIAYIVDEASMIGDHSDGGSNLLRDLVRYVFEADPTRKLLLVGDPVQLPPVGHNNSPALDVFKLGMAGLELFQAHLTEVKRQLTGSGILENAVYIRDAYESGNREDLRIAPARDVVLLENAYEAIETYLGYYQSGNPDRVLFITYSNYYATRVNQGLRQHIHGTEELLVPSDLLMVVRNNYAWGDNKRMPFIANGEMGTVIAVHHDTYEELYGLRWVNVELEFTDSSGEALLIECKVVLDLLQSKDAQLDRDTTYRVFRERQQTYLDRSPTQAAKALQTDPYVNALQVKYGYAVTGHKAQGGQWENVLIGFEKDYGNDLRAYLRWTYTVFTRAEERIFLLSCPFEVQ
ncbi:MAG: AAA family ATPase [Bacteroidia bacterium]